MRSKVTLWGHPVHVMLVAFPIALYTATPATLIAFAATGDWFWWRVATIANLAAIIAALVAAIPGAVDLVAVVWRGAGRLTGQLHAAANVIALALFALAYVVEKGYGEGGLAAAIALSLFGLASVLIAGFLGWSLVQDHEIGVTGRGAGRLPAAGHEDPGLAARESLRPRASMTDEGADPTRRGTREGDGQAHPPTGH